MKKILLTLIAIITITSIQAQDPALIENGWFLDKVVIDGVDIFPPVNDEVPNVPLSFEDFGVGLKFGSIVCDQLDGDPVFSGTDSFIVENLLQTLGGCANNDNLQFQLDYFQFYLANASMTDPYFYEINDDGNGGKNLIVTNVNGDTAHYNNTFLATEENNIATVSIYPNPTTIEVHIQTNEKVDEVNLYGVLGNLVISFETPSNTIDVSPLMPGVYFLEVVSNNKRSIQKLIKK